MEPTTPHERLAALTDAIEHAVSMADWAEASRLATERSPLLTSLKPLEPGPEAAAHLALAHRIQSSNDAIAAHAAAAQRELADEFQVAVGRLQAVNRYQKMAHL